LGFGIWDFELDSARYGPWNLWRSRMTLNLPPDAPRLQDLHAEVDHPLLRQRSLGRHDLLESAPGQVLHRDVVRAVVLAPVEHADHVGVLEPGRRLGLAPEAVRIIEAQPRVDKRIFPYRALTASTAFGNATSLLEIEGLTLNDLRHEGCSRLAEMSWTIQRIAAVTGHRSWNTLKRYTHVRKVGDKFAGWKWLDVIAPPKLAVTS